MTKINYINGDVRNGHEFIIAHGCNNRRAMGSGVALALFTRWPEVREVYMKSSMDLGSVSYTKILDPKTKTTSKLIANCITQDGAGNDGRQYVVYDAIALSFKTLNDFCKTYEITEIAMPKIGAGLGGGDWNIIEQLIKDNFTYPTVNVYVYE